jgi:hypothetical protein
MRELAGGRRRTKDSPCALWKKEEKGSSSDLEIRQNEGRASRFKTRQDFTKNTQKDKNRRGPSSFLIQSRIGVPEFCRSGSSQGHNIRTLLLLCFSLLGFFFGHRPQKN